MMRHVLAVVSVVSFTLLGAVPLVSAAGGKPKPEPSHDIVEESVQVTPEEHAQTVYNRGLAQRDDAREQEEKAAGATDDARKREKYEKRARKGYERAVKSQRDAIEAYESMHEAHAALGYALRKLGRFDEALTAYDRALALAPDYAEAIEYRGEAYLGLGRIDDAKEAYMTLFRQNADEIGMLAAAMGAWIEAQRGKDDANTEGAAALGTWLASREEIAAQLGRSGTGPVGGW